MKQLLLRLALLALLTRPALAGDAEPQRSIAAPARLPAAAVVTETPSSAALSPNLIAGLFVGSALFSFTLHLALRHHRHSVGRLDFVRRKLHLMTPAERDFLAVLEPIVRPVCRISVKVRLADLFEIRPERGRQSAYHLISNQHVAFTLTSNETGHILCGIDLADSSLQESDKAKRNALVDQLFASQQIPLVRLSRTRRYDTAHLHEIFAGILGQVRIFQGSFDCRR